MLDDDQRVFLRSLLSRARLRTSMTPTRRNKTKYTTETQFSGANPDERDPSTFANAISDVIVNRGWDLEKAAASIRATWPEIIGSPTCDHVKVESLKIESSGVAGLLVLRADSSAWASQLRLMTTQILQRVNEAAGAPYVTEIKVLGPTAPSWKHGPRSVPGRGPRDTYG